MPTNEEKVAATKTTQLAGNLLILAWITLGTLAVWLVNPLLGWLFLAFSAFSVYIIIRRLMCNSCYYCKSCTKGTAKLSLMFLGANRIPGLSKGSILGMNIYAYVVLTIIPALLLANFLLQQFSLVGGLVLAALLAVSVYGLAARLKKGNRLITG